MCIRDSGLPNVQAKLRHGIEERLLEGLDLQRTILDATALNVVAPPELNIEEVFTDAPAPSTLIEDPGSERLRQFKAFRANFVERDAKNAKLGLLGEKLALEYHRYRLQQLDRSDLAERTEHVSQTRGDGLGYDILTFDPFTSKEVFVEVKTTKYGIKTPFIVSDSERQFSEKFAEQFVRTRVYDYIASPRLYNVQGSINNGFRLENHSFVAIR